MARLTQNSDNRLYDVLIILKRHLNSCRECRSAIKSNDPYSMCRQGIHMVLLTTRHYDAILRLRVSARESGEPVCYPCPSPRAHGKTFEQTAIPVVVTGFQDKLF